MNFMSVSVAKVPPVSIKDIYADKDVPVRVIDLSACQPFGLNVFGHPRSEISFLRENANSALQESIAKALIYEKTYGSNLQDGLSLSQKFDSIKARYQQTASEISNYIEETGKLADKLEADKKAAELVNEPVEPVNKNGDE